MGPGQNKVALNFLKKSVNHLNIHARSDIKAVTHSINAFKYLNHIKIYQLNYLNYLNNFRNYLQNGHLVVIHTIQLHGTLYHSCMPAKFQKKIHQRLEPNN